MSTILIIILVILLLGGFGGYHGREPFVWIAFDESLHVDFDHGTAFLGSEVYNRKMLMLCKFPVSD